MKIVGLIPIKLNNERMPNKNLTRFDDGTPLAQLVFNTLSSVAELDDVYCYCSNPAIEEYLIGRVKFLRRSESLDTPETKRGDLIRAFLNDVPSADIIVLSHVTSPFLRAETVKQCVRAVAGGEYESAFAATRVLDFFLARRRSKRTCTDEFRSDQSSTLARPSDHLQRNRRLCCVHSSTVH